MLKIEGIRLSPGEDNLRGRCAKLLRVRDLRSLRILRRSLDARDDVVWIYTVAAEVDDEDRVLRRCKHPKVSRYTPPEPYPLPEKRPPPKTPPVVVGAGPAGLFAALVLAEAGMRPILLERGKRVEERREDVERFRSGGRLDPESNVQFGEGGAGAFSDGKLNTGTKDPRHRFILETMAACGAPEDILIDAKPHIGTDYLPGMLLGLRKRLLALGAEIRFSHRLCGIRAERGALSALEIETPTGRVLLPCESCILAPGHSARDVFSLLSRSGVYLEPKPFAVGVRIEHRQRDCDAAQYRAFAGHSGLPAATYKLSCHLPSGRGVFSFCVCPGGEVVAAASEQGHLVTNGMSPFARDGENINGALLVGIGPEDFGAGPLDGIAFQRRLEEAAFSLGGADYRAPAQRVEDFLLRRASAGPGTVLPTYRPGVLWTDLHRCLPPFLTEALEEALPILGRKLRGYDSPDGVLSAVESRSSSPVRIPRGETLQSSLRGLYPCGEGAGYAGGILSAAADGMRCAEALAACQE